MISSKARLAESAANILAGVPEIFSLVGTAYGAHLALKIALIAPERMLSLWLMGCDPATLQTGKPDIAAGFETSTKTFIDMLSGLVVRPADTEAAGAFRATAQRVGAKASAAQARAVGSRSDLTIRLSELSMFALLTWGDEDAIVPASVGRQIADAMPSATWHLIDHCDYLPKLERPAKAAMLYQAFFQDKSMLCAVA